MIAPVAVGRRIIYIVPSMEYTVLITDSVDGVCIEMLQQNGMHAELQVKRSAEELEAYARQADGWIIRSGTRITADLIEAAGRLKVIGRAGVGVDNIDLEAATRKGVLVINAPDGNTISTAEHTCAMLMALARRIPDEVQNVREGRWHDDQALLLETHARSAATRRTTASSTTCVRNGSADRCRAISGVSASRAMPPSGRRKW